MRTTDELIAHLAGDLRTEPWPARHRLLLGVGGGGIASALLFMLWLGPRPDMATAMETSPFWAKFAYTIALALVGLWAVDRLARPGGDARRAAIAGATVFVAILACAVVQWMRAPAAADSELMFGHSADICPWRILALSVPVFVGTVWAVRGLAPTRLRLAGLAAGLMAGGLGAWIYSFHCDETAMPFLANWYSGGIALLGVIGASLGRWLLRW